MILFEAFLVAIATYSIVPVPQFEWTYRNMKYAICFFPAVGVLCGVALWGWFALAQILHVSNFLFAVVAVCMPLLITGGIHMDGYMDTVDALASHQCRERKMEILKDPHCGAFAVIYCGIYLLLYAGGIYELYEKRQIPVICFVFVLSRALSALCAVNLPSARKEGMLSAYTKNAEKRVTTIWLLAVCVCVGIGMLTWSPVVGGTVLLMAAGSFFIYHRMTMKQFGGVTGDTSGFFLQVCELACIFGAWIGTYVAVNLPG